MVSYSQTTIVAVSTPPGIGGIAVLRISGPEAFSVAQKVSQQPKSKFKDRYAIFTPLYSSSGQEVDNGIITFFRKPNSYTGEDVVEISCHGGNVICNTLMEACLFFGCEPAGPGEFTKRAFLNGKMDLSQAEAVAHIISSKTALGEEINYRILSGKFSSLLNHLKGHLLNTISVIEAELDFSEDEIDPIPTSNKIDAIEKAIDTCNKLLDSYSTGRILTEGAIVSIIGKPNVGKSRLLNTIISEERVIVTEIPGTTRDAVEVYYQIQGVPIRFFDTAGIRKTKDPIESLGVKISHDFTLKSDLVLWVFDVVSDITDALSSFNNPPFSNPFIPVFNKIDLIETSEVSSISSIVPPNSVFVSAKTGEGIADLIEEIYNTLIGSERATSNEVFLTSARHYDSISKCAKSLSIAKEGLVTSNKEGELVAADLRNALSYIDRLLGITTSDDILENIFSSFCVGK